jgi:hypothetical protein
MAESPLKKTGLLSSIALNLSTVFDQGLGKAGASEKNWHQNNHCGAIIFILLKKQPIGR